jgi:hypothetical protein
MITITELTITMTTTDTGTNRPNENSHKLVHEINDLKSLVNLFFKKENYRIFEFQERMVIHEKNIAYPDRVIIVPWLWNLWIRRCVTH